MLKKFLLGASMSLTVLAVSVIGLGTLKDNGNMKIDTQNVAGTYIDYVDGEYHVDWSTGMKGVDKKYKDVYTTTSKTLSNIYDEKFRYVDSWRGPSEKKRKETVTYGTERKTSFSSGVEADVFKISAAHDIANSAAYSVELSFIFPGDNTRWSLYVTRRDINKVGYTSRTSYVSELCYTYIWGIVAWDYYWSSYTYDSNRSFAASYACDTVENQYGHDMINQ